VFLRWFTGTLRYEVHICTSFNILPSSLPLGTFPFPFPFVGCPISPNLQPFSPQILSLVYSPDDGSRENLSHHRDHGDSRDLSLVKGTSTVLVKSDGPGSLLVRWP